MYGRIGRHLCFKNCTMTSSEASLSDIVPKTNAEIQTRLIPLKMHQIHQFKKKIHYLSGICADSFVLSLTVHIAHALKRCDFAFGNF